MQKEKIDSLKNEMKHKITNVENWVSSLGDKLKTGKTEALENLRKSSLELNKKISDLKIRVSEVENYSEKKKTEINDELDNLGSLLDSKISEQEEELDNFKTEVADSVDRIDERINAELNEQIHEVYSDFRVVANDIQLRLNTLRLSLMDEGRKNKFLHDVDQKKHEIKTDVDNLKEKLSQMKEGTKNDFSVIQDGIKKDFKRLEDFVNRFRI